MPTEDELTLRDQLAKAFDDEAAAPVKPESEPAKQPDTEAKKVEKPEKAEDDESAAKPAKKTKEPGEDPEAKKPAKEPAKDGKGDDSEKSKIDPPARWTKEEKEEFEALDPKIQGILLKRNKGLEASYTKAMQEVSEQRTKFQAAEKVETAFAPHRAHFAQLGLADDVALKSVLDTYMAAYRDPIGFVKWFAGQRNLDLSQFAPAAKTAAQAPASGGTGDQGAASPLPPEVKVELEALRATVASLQTGLKQHDGYVQTREQQEYARARSEAAQELQVFQAKTDEHGSPLYPFFEDVKVDMGKLMQAGMAKDLADAYDRAVYARPDLRTKMLETRELAWRREQTAKATEAAKRARVAASSVSASTVATPGARSPQSTGNLREDLMAAWEVAESA